MSMQQPFIAVTTTRIFCRPGCPARAPRADHVRHYTTPEAALADGFRPCLRCRPLGERLVAAATLETPLGPMLGAATDDGVCLLEFTDRRMLPTQLNIVERRLGRIVPGRHAHLERLYEQLNAYFAGQLREFSIPLLAPGSPFEQAVWRELRAIPAGQTRSYDALAGALGRNGAARAVGRANGMNRIAIVIPCHRVIGSDGSLTGYGGGLWRKQRLLEVEAAYARGASAAGDAPVASDAGERPDVMRTMHGVHGNDPFGTDPPPAPTI